MKLNGMFAIAIHDARDNSAFNPRSHGQKPCGSPNWPMALFFASEVRALMQARPDRTLRTEMIAEVMQYGYSTPVTFNEISNCHQHRFLLGNGSYQFNLAPDFDTKTIFLTVAEPLEVNRRQSSAAYSERPLGSCKRRLTQRSSAYILN